MSYVTTDKEQYNIELWLNHRSYIFSCEICGWGFMLISVKDQPVILAKFVFQFHKCNSNEVCLPYFSYYDCSGKK